MLDINGDKMLIWDDIYYGVLIWISESQKLGIIFDLYVTDGAMKWT